MTKLLTTVAAVVAALAASLSASGATPVISELAYSPRPVYDDDSVLAVSFRANRAARRGYEWGVLLHITGAYARPGSGCAWAAFSWDAEFGGNPRRHRRGKGTHLMDVIAEAGGQDSYWCRGRALLSIVEHRIGSAAIGRAISGATIEFRIPRAP